MHIVEEPRAISVQLQDQHSLPSLVGWQKVLSQTENGGMASGSMGRSLDLTEMPQSVILIV